MFCLGVSGGEGGCMSTLRAKKWLEQDWELAEETTIWAIDLITRNQRWWQGGRVPNPTLVRVAVYANATRIAEYREGCEEQARIQACEEPPVGLSPDAGEQHEVAGV